MGNWKVTVHSADGTTGDTGIVEATDEASAKTAMLSNYSEGSPVLANPVFVSVEEQ